LSMLKGRFRKGRAVYANERGLNSPMIRVEKLVVSIILCRAAMHQPCTVTECIELANSPISESLTQLELVKWKREVVGKQISGEGAHKVGYKWWHNFVRFQKIHLSIEKAIQFNTKRNE
jgi:hypothetical protein